MFGGLKKSQWKCGVADCRTRFDHVTIADLAPTVGCWSLIVRMLGPQFITAMRTNQKYASTHDTSPKYRLSSNSPPSFMARWFRSLSLLWWKNLYRDLTNNSIPAPLRLNDWMMKIDPHYRLIFSVCYWKFFCFFWCINLLLVQPSQSKSLIDADHESRSLRFLSERLMNGITAKYPQWWLRYCTFALIWSWWVIQMHSIRAMETSISLI